LAHRNTVFKQLLDLVPRHDFEKLAAAHHIGQKLRATSRWSQFVGLLLGQLAGCRSLREIVTQLQAHASAHYQLGVKSLPRETFSRLNRNQPSELYQALYGWLLQRCQARTPQRRKGPQVLLDASLIDLTQHCDWAYYANGKQAMKLHIGLDGRTELPIVAEVTAGRDSDLSVAWTLSFEPGTTLVFDRGYMQFSYFKSLMDKDIFFVTRRQKKTPYDVIRQAEGALGDGVLADQTVQFTGERARQAKIGVLRLVTYHDSASDRTYEFLTNHFDLSAEAIAQCYRARWQVELFFKWVKQHLKLSSFLGRNRNAVLSQIWVALISYLLLWLLRAQARHSGRILDVLRPLRLSLFLHRDLIALIRGDPPKPQTPHPQAQLAFS
jgi:hypothetical protein